MKETGILRRIDELGRIVVPKEIRKKLKIREGDNLDIFVSEDNVILRKYSPLNDLETILKILLEGIKNNTNLSVVVTDLSKVIASTKLGVEVNDEITELFTEMIMQKEQIHINKSVSIEVVEGFKTNQNLIIKPIEIYGDLFGAIILFTDFDTSSNLKDHLDLIHYFCTEYIQS